MSYDRRLYLQWEELNRVVPRMVTRVAKLDVTSICGCPRGGLVLATCLSHATGLPLVSSPSVYSLWVDDIYDSGRTYRDVCDRWMKPRAALTWFRRDHVVVPDSVYSVESVATGVWVVFPWEYDNANAPQEQSSAHRRKPQLSTLVSRECQTPTRATGHGESLQAQEPR